MRHLLLAGASVRQSEQFAARLSRSWAGSWRMLAILLTAFTTFASFAAPTVDSRPYYFHYSASMPIMRDMGVTSTRPEKDIVPWLKMTNGGAIPCCYRISDEFAVSDRGFRVFALGLFGPEPHLGTNAFWGYRDGSCNGVMKSPLVFDLGTKQTTQSRWIVDPWTFNVIETGEPAWCNEFAYGIQWLWPITTDELSFGMPVRRTALDGGQYDASPMVHKRNGLPWMTWHFGYHLGLTSIQSDWDDANLDRAQGLAGVFVLPSPRQNFELTSLPPPWVEDDVVEYVNRADFPAQPDGQFFYTAIAADKAILDAASPPWQRTGRSFKSGGYVATCRFYGGKNGGPNTHFYTADAKECEDLKKISFLDFEGSSFTVNMPLPGATVDGIKPCPIDSKPLFRLYNNATHSGGRFVSNHRYTTDRADVTAFTAKGWVDEGQVMCVPI